MTLFICHTDLEAVSIDPPLSKLTENLSEIFLKYASPMSGTAVSDSLIEAPSSVWWRGAPFYAKPPTKKLLSPPCAVWTWSLPPCPSRGWPRHPFSSTYSLTMACPCQFSITSSPVRWALSNIPPSLNPYAVIRWTLVAEKQPQRELPEAGGEEPELQKPLPTTPAQQDPSRRHRDGFSLAPPRRGSPRSRGHKAWESLLTPQCHIHGNKCSLPSHLRSSCWR